MTSLSSEWRISTSSVIKILVTAVLVYTLLKLLPLLVLMAFAVLLACSLYPAIVFLERWLPHWAAALTVAVAVGLALVGTLMGIVPPLVEQFSIIGQKIPEFLESIRKMLPEGMAKSLDKAIHSSPVPAEHVLSTGQYVFGAATDFVLIVIVALYFATDGKRTYRWLRAFFSADHRKKLDETATEASSIIVAYVAGQFVTSLLCSIFVFTVLTILEVPAALVLAVLAGLFDILPLLGFFIFTIPAVLFALSVSVGTAVTVAVLYTAYHLLENYLIVPKIYGNRLRLTDLVVLLSVLAGAYVGGIPGAILILPVVAAYPTLERIWLAKYVGRDVIRKHEQIE